MQWFCARTKPGQDHIALQHLKRQCFPTFYPFEVVERVRHGRIVREAEPFFPSYILIKFKLDTWAWQAINSTRGIMRLLSFRADGVPSPASTCEVELLQMREKTGELFASEVLRIRKDDLVRIKYGLNSNSVGRVVRTRAERIELLLSCFGREVRVTAPAHALEVVGHVDPVH